MSHETLPASDWADAPGEKLEKKLTVIAHALLNRAETLLRLVAAREYQYRLDRRAAMVAELEEKTAEEARQKLEKRELHQQACRQSLISLSRDYQDARNIRDMVAALKCHPDNTEANQATFGTWAVKALEIADAIDPLARPLHEVARGLGVDPAVNANLQSSAGAS